MKASELVELLKRGIEDHGDWKVITGEQHERVERDEVVEVRFVGLDFKSDERAFLLCFTKFTRYEE